MDHRMRVLLALLHLSLLATCVPGYAFIGGTGGPVTHQEALEGGSTTLLCDSSLVTADDDLMLLVWYKDKESIYSFDARSTTEWSSSSFNTNNRLRVDVKGNPITFTISALREADQAFYHCRIEFLLSPSRYTGVNLTVIVLPSQPFFLDELGNKIENKAGPFYEGDTLVLTCLVIGGRPTPRINWYSNDVLVDASDSESDIPNVRQNELYLPLTRNNAKGLTCKASNTQLTHPISASVEVELYLSADFVKIRWIQGTEDNLQVAETVIVKCVVTGSYPSPDLAWWLGHKHLTHHSNQTWNDTNRTAVSYLHFQPTVSDDQVTLTCVATNPAMPPGRNSKADVITLNVKYAPTVKILILGNGHQNQVVELDPLHLECEVKANPPCDKFTWYFNDVKIEPGIIWGADVTSHQLLVVEATRIHSGLYSCEAKNILNVTRSERINITVYYQPECIGNGITLNGEILMCNTKALPAPDTFYWHIIIESNDDTQHLTTGSATLHVSQVNGPLRHMISITCEADNGIASQEKPCKKSLSLKHLSPPQPQQCDLAYERAEFQIRCMPVENATHYEVSIWRLSTSNASLILDRRKSIEFGTSQALTRNAVDHWLIKEGLGVLGAGDEAGAAACNRYGCSAPLLLRPSETLLNAATPWWRFILHQDGISLGVVILVLLFVTSTALVLCIARRSRAKTPAPVIQVLQLDDLTRDFPDVAGDAASSLRSSSSYSTQSDDASVSRRHHLTIREWELPPDVTLNPHIESVV